MTAQNAIPAPLAIAIAEGKAAAEQETDTLARFRAAARVTRGHYLLVTEDEQFRAAVGAVILLSDEETRRRIDAEMRRIQALSSLLAGVPVDLEAVEAQNPEEPVGLLAAWKADRKEGRA